MAERGLYLLRHAKSSWEDAALSDRERPLNERGRMAARRIAEHLRKTRPEIDLILCSSAVRAVETLDGVREGLRAGIDVSVEDELYGASADDLLQRVRALPGEVGATMLVGHNPGVEGLASLLAVGGEEEALERMGVKYPTGGLATLTFDGPWAGLVPGAAQLESFVVPRDLT